MSIFDKDLIERSPRVPKEDAIKYSLDWTLHRAKNYLSGYLKDHQRNSNTLAFCQEYLRAIYDGFFEYLLDGFMPKEYPEECPEYPALRSYDVEVNCTNIVNLNSIVFTIHIIYKTHVDFTKYYTVQFEL